MLSPYKVHKNLRNFLLFSSAITLLATAHTTASAADSEKVVYVLQLGSFDSKASAEKKWQQLKTQNPDTLGKLNVHISQVSMSGDTGVIYRTQAGPVESHEQATDLCGKLQEQGAQCYVVETAMFTSDTPVEEESADNEEVQSALPWKGAAHPKTAAAHAATGEAEPVEPNTHLASSDVVIPDRAPKFLDADQHEEQPAKVEQVASAAKPAEIMAEPAPAVAANPEPAPAQKKPGFFSSLFSNHSSPTSSSPSPAAERHSYDYVSGRQPPSYDKKEQEEEAPATQTASTAPAEEVPAPAVAEPAAIPAPVSEEPAPAPAPATTTKKSGLFSGLFSSNKPSAPAPAAVPVPTAVPAPAPAQSAASRSTVGKVSVAEAIRVPLTEGDSSGASPAIASRELSVTAPTPQVGGVYWAQISYFPDEASAHNFYEGFRSAYPNLADGIRMRITRPYSSTSSLGGRVTLRIGSFASADDIASICTLASQLNLDCVSVKDSGTNTAHYSNPEKKEKPEFLNAPAPIPTPSAPEENANFLDAPNRAEYWVQIGTFNSADDAWDKWKSIKKADKKIVRGLNAAVSEPEASDSQNTMYRLRTGPFTHREVAETLCTRLEQHDESCVVVSEVHGKAKF